MGICGKVLTFLGMCVILCCVSEITSFKFKEVNLYGKES